MLKKRLLPIAFSLLLAGCAGISTQTSPVIENGLATTPVTTGVYQIPSNGDDIVGQDFRITPTAGDTLSSIAQRYDIGANEINQANPSLVGKRLTNDDSVVVPDAFVLPPKQFRNGIVINVAELRLYYFDNTNNTVYTFPVALGREGWRTPITETYVYRKQAAPSWNAPLSIREYMLAKHGKVIPAVVPPGPDNPLGDYAIYLQLSGYLIHGTNDPSSIGRLVSSGCIRMYNQDVTQLFPLVNRGTPVRIIYYPNKVGWYNQQLYLEAQKPVTDNENYYQTYEVSVKNLIDQATQNQSVNIDWNKVNSTLAQSRGVPVIISESGS